MGSCVDPRKAVSESSATLSNHFVGRVLIKTQLVIDTFLHGTCTTVTRLEKECSDLFPNGAAPGADIVYWLSAFTVAIIVIFLIRSFVNDQYEESED